MKWIVPKKAVHAVRTLLVALFFACATAHMQSAPPTNEFATAVQPLNLKAQQVATVPDVIIIDVLPNARGKNNFTYVPSELHVPPGTRVAWVSWQGSFKLTFDVGRSDGPWPFTEKFEPITPDNASLPYRAVRTVNGSPPPKPQSYYHFKVELPSLGAVDPYCPPIIID